MQFFTRTRQRDENCGKLSTPLVGVLADGDLVTVASSTASSPSTGRPRRSPRRSTDAG
jgi:predicted SnoaL-like aldol condensation-catalyzing enzyme